MMLRYMTYKCKDYDELAYAINIIGQIADDNKVRFSLLESKKPRRFNYKAFYFFRLLL